MKAKQLLFVLLVLIITVFSYANERPLNKFMLKNNLVPANKSIYRSPVLTHLRNEFTGSKVLNQMATATQAGFKIARSTANSYVVMVDSSRNGYGWLSDKIRSIDFNQDEGYLLIGFRKYEINDPATGILGALDANVNDGLANAEITAYGYLNAALTNTIGARYPGAIALDLPFVHFNQYISGDANETPALSDPYLVTDYFGGYGSIDWSEPFQMDEGYQHHDSPTGNRLWNGPVNIVKDASGVYHYLGVYTNWYLSSEGLPSDYVALTATADDPTDQWTINTSPTVFDVTKFTMLNPAVAMNASGFGVMAWAGDKVPLDSLFYDQLKITYMTTEDYGVTWSGPETVDVTQMGIPDYVYATDSLILDSITVDSSTGVKDTTYYFYEGPTSVWTNSDMSVVVDDDNNIYIGCNLFWGEPFGSHGQYVAAEYSGQWVAIKKAGSDTWEGGHIAYPNGAFVGDDYIPDQFIYFWGSEIDLALDENGELYAAWFDRRHTDVQLAEKPRYFIDAGTDYKTDIYTAHSKDGGKTWGTIVNITDSPDIDEYELSLSKHASSKDGGTVYVAFCTVDPNSELSVPNGDDVYIDRVNRVWLGEASGVVSGIEQGSAAGVATRFELRQNYPNPFNPTTTIEFVAAANTRAQLNVYSITGQKVAEIFNQRVKKGHTYTVNFDGSKLASGIYFYKLFAGNQVQVRKMALIK